MSQSVHNGENRTADDLLPPVEPPSAGFILQLFVVPAIIVLIIVLVWLMFNWLAHMGNDPRRYVDALSRDNEARWQAAVNLATALSDKTRYDDLKRDSATAAKLAGILAQELSRGRTSNENSLTFRMFLCRALGEFRVPEPLPVLLRAAGPQNEPEVRRAALEATALLVENLRDAGNVAALRSEQLVQTLVQTARDPNPLVRSTAAFALGVFGDERARAELYRLLADSQPDVRYNAATGLARHGDDRAIPVLMEMLSVKPPAGVKAEQLEEMQGFKLALIRMNALRAVEQLVARNPEADVKPLAKLVRQLLKKDAQLPANVRSKAESVLKILERAKPSSPPRTPPKTSQRRSTIQGQQYMMSANRAA